MLPIAAALAQDLTPHGCRSGLRSARRPVIEGAVSLAGERHPVRVWYDPAHAHSVAIAPLVVEMLETSWDVQVAELGFQPPVLPDAAGGPEFDAYLVRYGVGGAYVAPDGAAYGDAVPGDGRNSTSSFMVLDHRLSEALVRSYIPHEFNHACQFATDWSEPTLTIWEATATAAQDWTSGAAGVWDADVPSFQEGPQFPALTGDSYTLWYDYELGYLYEYGAAFWVMFLDEVAGDGDRTGGRRLWDAAANEGRPNEPDAVDAFATAAGMPLGDALNQFALVRFLTGPDWDPRGLPDASGWGPRFAVPASPVAAAELVGEHVPADPPRITGQVFWDAAPPTGDALVIEATSASGLSSGLMVATWSADGGVWDDAAVDGPVRVPLEGVTRVVIGLTNLGPPGWDGDDDAYVPGDQRLVVALEGPPGETADTAALPDPRPSGERAAGCGCDSSSTSGWLGVLVAWGALRRDRRRRGIGCSGSDPARWWSSPPSPSW